MAPTHAVDDRLDAAIATIKHYVAQVSGSEPTDEELARALTRYFVLKEINDHIVMQRKSAEP